MPSEPTADLAVSLNILTNSVGFGSPMTLSATVTNNGPATATGVVLTNSLPAGASVVSIGISQGTCTNIGSGVICEIGEFFFQAEDGIRFRTVTGVQTCALPI